MNVVSLTRVGALWAVFAHLPASQGRNGELWWDGPSDGSGWLVGGWGPRSFRWGPSFVALDAASSDPLEFGVDPVNTWTFCPMLCFFMHGSVLGLFCNRIRGLLVFRMSLPLFSYQLPLESWLRKGFKSFSCLTWPRTMIGDKSSQQVVPAWEEIFKSRLLRI